MYTLADIADYILDNCIENDGSRMKFNFSFLVETPSRVNHKKTSPGNYKNLEPRYTYDNEHYVP